MGTPRPFWVMSWDDVPPEARPKLTVVIEVVHEERGGCAIRFSAAPGSPLVSMYGGKGRALAACRDMIVDDFDTFVREFYDED